MANFGQILNGIGNVAKSLGPVISGQNPRPQPYTSPIGQYYGQYEAQTSPVQSTTAKDVGVLDKISDFLDGLSGDSVSTTKKQTTISGANNDLLLKGLAFGLGGFFLIKMMN